MILKRVDVPIFAKNICDRIMNLITNNGKLYHAVDILLEEIQNLLNGKISSRDMIICKRVTNYKSDKFHIQFLINELKKEGKIINVGDNLEYIVIQDPEVKEFRYRVKSYEHFLQKQNTSEPYHVDYKYYITRYLNKNMKILFDMGFYDEITKVRHVSIKLGATGSISLNDPVRMIVKLIRDDFDLLNFKNAIRFNLEPSLFNKMAVEILKTVDNVGDVEVLEMFKNSEGFVI